MKKFLAVLTLACLLTGCVARAAGGNVYETTFLTLFDTVTTIKGYAADEAEFQAIAQEIHDGLLEYHQLYDIYNEYPGVVNLKTVNDAAGGPPVKVEQPILDLLLFCQEVYTETEGRVNAAMGSVLSLWHEAREAGINDPEHAALPDRAALEEAARTVSQAVLQPKGRGTSASSDTSGAPSHLSHSSPSSSPFPPFCL